MRVLLTLIVLVASSTAVRGAELLKPGDAFPAWQMVDQAGVAVSSSDLAGKTYLLWFYPRAGTPGCTAEGNGLRQQYPAFQAKGVEILGVSFDEPKDNAVFAAEEKFPFRLLSDRDRALAASVGAASSREQATAGRISYLVGGDGKVLRVFDKVDPATHADDVLGSLR